MSAGPVEPAHSAQNRTHSSVDLGNWLLYYMARLAVGVSPLARSPQFFFPQLPYVRRSGFMHIMSNPHANPNVTDFSAAYLESAVRCVSTLCRWPSALLTLQMAQCRA